MQEEAIYRCVNPACGRLMPRPVKFCPWCGTAQADAHAAARDAGPGGASAAMPAGAPGTAGAGAAGAAAAAAAAGAATPAVETRRAAEAVAAVSAAAQLSGWSDAPLSPLPSASDAAPPGRDAADARAGAAAGTASPAGTADPARSARDAGPAGPAAPSRPASGMRATRLGTLFGHSERAPAAAPQSVPRPPLSPTPLKPRRRPIRLRWWLCVLAVLWGVWLVARPGSSRWIGQRIAHATALAQACKTREAQDELIALRKTRATPAQLEELQAALNEGAAACTRQRQRDRAWTDASAAADAALADGNPERAHARLQAFTRRWGEDAHTRALRSRIEDARHPLAAPPG